MLVSKYYYYYSYYCSCSIAWGFSLLSQILFHDFADRSRNYIETVYYYRYSNSTEKKNSSRKQKNNKEKMVGIKIKKKKESDIVKYIDFSNFENKPL